MLIKKSRLIFLGLFLFIVIAFFGVFEFIGKTLISCGDTDGGKDLYLNGYVSGSYGGADGGFIHAEDSCASSTEVNEAFCENFEIKYEIIPCPAGEICGWGVCMLDETSETTTTSSTTTTIPITTTSSSTTSSSTTTTSTTTTTLKIITQQRIIEVPKEKKPCSNLTDYCECLDVKVYAAHDAFSWYGIIPTGSIRTFKEITNGISDASTDDVQILAEVKWKEDCGCKKENVRTIVEIDNPNFRRPNKREEMFVPSKSFARPIWVPGTVSVSFDKVLITEVVLANVRHTVFYPGAGTVKAYIDNYYDNVYDNTYLCKDLTFNVIDGGFFVW